MRPRELIKNSLASYFLFSITGFGVLGLFLPWSWLLESWWFWSLLAFSPILGAAVMYFLSSIMILIGSRKRGTEVHGAAEYWKEVRRRKEEADWWPAVLLIYFLSFIIFIDGFGDFLRFVLSIGFVLAVPAFLLFLFFCVVAFKKLFPEEEHDTDTDTDAESYQMVKPDEFLNEFSLEVSGQLGVFEFDLSINVTDSKISFHDHNCALITITKMGSEEELSVTIELLAGGAEWWQFQEEAKISNEQIVDNPDYQNYEEALKHYTLELGRFEQIRYATMDGEKLQLRS
jgi:hypothetical protein